MRNSSYIHGTAPDEQRRLSRLNDLVNERSLEALALRGGERVLDVGCGLAQLTQAMAVAAGPSAKVVGVERSPEQLAEARLRLAELAGAERVELRAGDAFDLPLRPEEWGSFDVAHARFLLEHVPDPLAVVRGMLRAVRPGGRVVLEDDDHELLHLWPEPPGVEAVWRAYVRTYDRSGNDPFVGRRLVQLLHEAGAKPRRNDLLFFGSCAGSGDLEAYVENLAGILEGARGALVGPGFIASNELDAALAALRNWGRQPEAAFWYSIAWAEGTRPA